MHVLMSVYMKMSAVSLGLKEVNTQRFEICSQDLYFCNIPNHGCSTYRHILVCVPVRGVVTGGLQSPTLRVYGWASEGP